VNNWKIVSQIALYFGIVFIVFAIFAALITFEIDSLEYGSNAPQGFIEVSALASMLVFLLFAALSFIVAWITRSYAKEKVSEPQGETQTDIV